MPGCAGDPQARDPLTARARVTLLVLMTEEETATAAFGLRLLARGEPVSVKDLARHVGVTVDALTEILAGLDDRVAFDSTGRIVGLYGLSLEPSRHRLRLAGVALYTWCAFDAVAIPAALGYDATVETRCGYCDVPITVPIMNGHPPTSTPLVGWLPEAPPGSPVREAFCASANLFCDRTHLDSWLTESGVTQGIIAGLDEMAHLGATNPIWSAQTST
jgi:hypothetical protein